jgi:hypothetical protein
MGRTQKEVTMDKYCLDPYCGKLLIQKDDETKGNFKKRTYCGRSCSSQHHMDQKLAKSRKAKIKKKRAINRFTAPLPFY